MPPRLSTPFLGLVAFLTALCVPSQGEIAYEELSEFQPGAHSYASLTLGPDGYAYAINSASTRGRIVRMDAAGNLETALIFRLATTFTSVQPWLAIGPDNSLYGGSSRSSELGTTSHVIYRLGANGPIEEIGNGRFTSSPVVGADGALYGIEAGLAGARRFRSDRVFEIVPGTEGVPGFRNPVMSGGVVYYPTSAALWKVGAGGSAQQIAQFNSQSPTASTLGSNLTNLVVGKSGTVYGMSRAGGPGNRGVIFRVLPSDTLEPLVAFGTGPGQIDGNALAEFTLAEGPGGVPYTIVSGPQDPSMQAYAITTPNTPTLIDTVPPVKEPIRLITGNDDQVYFAATVGDLTVKRTFFKLSLENGCTVAGQSPYSGPSGETIQRYPIVGPDGGIWAISSADQGIGRFGALIRLKPDGTFHQSPMVPGRPLPGFEPGHLRALGDGSLVGTMDLGSVFRVFPDGHTSYVTKVTEARFAPVLFDDGSLVGASVDSSGAYGFLYRVRPDGEETRVTFNTPETPIPGGQPDGPLVRGINGWWYGLTRYGGTGNAGTIYKVSPSFEVQSVYQFGDAFEGKRPVQPAGSLIDGEDGSLYGVTVAGGEFGFGGLIKLNLNGNVSLVTSFPEPIARQSLFPSDPAPIELTLAKDGWFYGVTSYRFPTPIGSTEVGNGFVYRVSRNGKFEVLGRFTGKKGILPGRQPASRLTKGPRGALYGVTEFGGSADVGTVFRVQPGGPVRSLAAFTGPAGKLPGSRPTASLVRRGNTLFGACTKGGAIDAGTLFVVRLNDQVSLLQAFTGLDGATPGIAPNSLALGEDGHVYGTTGSDGMDLNTVSPNAIQGSVFRLNITDSTQPSDDQLELPITHADLLANDSYDLSIQSPRIAGITQPVHGRAILNDDGTVTYKPGSTFPGSDTFTYTVRDGGNVLGTATVTVVDTTPPKFVTVPGVPPIPLIDQATVSLPDVAGLTKVSDASGFVSVTQEPPAGTAVGFGGINVTLTATDRAGNVATRVEFVEVYDGAAPVITQKPADRTIVRASGDPAPPCPDLTAELIATDNVKVDSVVQYPPAGTLLPYGYTRIIISVSDGLNTTDHSCAIRVVPPSEVAVSSGDIVPGLEGEHRFVSFGPPMVGADGTLVYAAQIKAALLPMKTALFRKPAGAAATPIIAAGEDAGPSGIFTSFGSPLIGSDGTVVVEAKTKGSDGSRGSGIWSAAIGQAPAVIVTTGSPLPLNGSTDTFRDFTDVSILESGAMLVHATINEKSSRSTQRTLWLVANGSWKLLLRTGESLTVSDKASELRDFGYGMLPPKVGSQTRSFNESGRLALRLKLADGRTMIARVSLTGDDVVVEPVAKIGPGATDWLSLGTPTIGNNGDIAFRGTLKMSGKQVQAIARVAADEYIARVIMTENGSAGQWRSLSDPIVTPDDRIAFSALRSDLLKSQLITWQADGPNGGTLVSHSPQISNGIALQTIRRFERIGAFEGGIRSVVQFSQSPDTPVRRGIMLNVDSNNALLQAEGEPLVTGLESDGRIAQIDFLTPVPGVGGQTRAINAAGQAAFRAKLSSGQFVIHLTSP